MIGNQCERSFVIEFRLVSDISISTSLCFWVKQICLTSTMRRNMNRLDSDKLTWQVGTRLDQLDLFHSLQAHGLQVMRYTSRLTISGRH